MYLTAALISRMSIAVFIQNSFFFSILLAIGVF